jgi:hypothetical protein
MIRGINRRDAIRVTLGLADRVAMEREQQSAIDAARGYTEPLETSGEPQESVPGRSGGSLLARVRERLSRIRLPDFISRRQSGHDSRQTSTSPSTSSHQELFDDS